MRAGVGVDGARDAPRGVLILPPEESPLSSEFFLLFAFR